MNIRLKCLAARPMASVRLLCIPFAGGGTAAFRGWAKLLPDHIEAFAVQLPGREDTLREPAFVAWRPMMEALIAAIAPLPPLPTAILGHSLGALIALELGRWMHRSQAGRLKHLFVAGRPWPGSWTGERSDLSELADDEFLKVLDSQYGSLSSSLSHPEIRDLVLPALRADLQLLGSYRYAPSSLLDCPLSAFGGSHDAATTPENLAAWHQETRGPFRVQLLNDGQHFFLETHRSHLIAAIAAALES